MHNRLIETMLESSCHIIGTMRSKTDYLQTQNDRGRTEIRKVGLAPVQRDGMDYEFTVVFDLGMDHTVTISKDRTGLFDGQVFTITQDTGRTLRRWLDSGAEIVPTAQDIRNTINRLYRGYMELFDQDSQAAQSAMLAVTEGRASREWTADDMKRLTEDLAIRIQKRGVMDGMSIPQEA